MKSNPVESLNKRKGLLSMALALWSLPAIGAPGDHIGTEGFEVTPELEMLSIYRTNLFLQEGTAGGGAPVTSGAAVQLRPNIGLRMKGDEADIRLKGGYAARKFLNPDLSNLDRFKDMNLGLKMNLLPNSLVGVRAFNNFFISGRETEAVGSDDAYVTHLKEQGQGTVVIRPGSSLSLDLGGGVDFDSYQVPEGRNVTGESSLNSRLGYGANAAVDWSFFPKTAFIAGYEMTWFDWDDNLIDARGDLAVESEFGDFIGVPDGQEWQAKGGLRGRLTPKLEVELVGGFGKLLYDEGSVAEDDSSADADSSELDGSVAGFAEDVDTFAEGFLLDVGIRYLVNEGTNIVLGYERGFEDVFFTNFVGFDTARISIESRLADRLLLTPQFGYRLEKYVGEVSRDDHLLRARFNVEYSLTSYLFLKSGVWWIRRASADGAHPEMEYDDVHIRAGLTLVY